MVQKMEEILFDKNYEDIDNIFNLYTVMKQERDIGSYAYMLDENIHLSNASKLTKE